MADNNSKNSRNFSVWKKILLNISMMELLPHKRQSGFQKQKEPGQNWINFNIFTDIMRETLSIPVSTDGQFIFVQIRTFYHSNMCSLLRQHMILPFRAASNSTGADTWHIVHVLEPQSCGKLPSYNKEHESKFDCLFYSWSFTQVLMTRMNETKLSVT